MTDEQHVVNAAEGDDDGALGAFIADVLELAGSFRRLADGIAAEEGLTRTLWYGLSVFSADPLTVAQAARRLGTSRQAVQRTANDLVDRGLARPQANPDHRGSPFVVLTADGRSALDRVAAAASASRRDWFGDDDLAVVESVHPGVRRLLDALRRT